MQTESKVKKARINAMCLCASTIERVNGSHVQMEIVEKFGR